MICRINQAINLRDFLGKLPANGNSTVPQGIMVLAFHYEYGGALSQEIAGLRQAAT